MLAFKDVVRQRALIAQGMTPDQALTKIHEDDQRVFWEQEQIRQASLEHEQQAIWRQQEAQRLAWEQEQQQEAQRLAWEEEQKVKWEQEQRAAWLYNQAQAQAAKIVNDATIYAKQIIADSQKRVAQIYRKNEADISALRDATIASQKVLDETLQEYMSIKSQIEIMKREIKKPNHVVLNPEEED